MDKQGIVISSVASIILVLIAFGGLSALLINIFGLFEGPEANLEICHALFGAKKIESTLFGDTFNAIDQNCVTTQYEVEAKDLKTPDNVQEYFADRMGRVWWAVHEGTIPELWNEKGNLDITGAWFDKEECVILATISYQGDADDIAAVPFSDFQRFLLEETYFETQYGVTWTYSDYVQFYGEQTSAKAVPGALTLQENMNLIPGKVYGIGVLSTTKGNVYGKALVGAGVAAVGAAGVLLAAPTGGASLVVMGKFAAATVAGGAALGATTFSDTDYPILLILAEYSVLENDYSCRAQTQAR